ncbi:MAG: O-acetyl-ADP-ribose deacetylase [Ruminococcaceae bacterium]|nr:O-acetyl-ADP-ribose deacetylase [Oscillospiraceae bacterium]
MPLQIIRQDITKMDCDAIVNAANNTLLGGGGVDGMIHRAAGPELREECMTLHGCETGQAKLTKGYALPARYVIHTVGPIWQGGGCGERELLASCYRNSLALAAEHGFETVAFPLISSGIFGYPKVEALEVATETISAFLQEHDMTVYLTVFGRSSFAISEELFDDVQSFIDDRYVDAHTDRDYESRRRGAMLGFSESILRESKPRARRRETEPASFSMANAADFPAPEAVSYEVAEDSCDVSLEDALSAIDESFSQMLLRKIDERGMTDAQCYKKANIDRKLFSKIRGDVHYKPSKATALAFAVALELPLSETRELLMKAGYALSRSSKFDIIVEYFIDRRQYDIYRINETLFAFDQALLGSVG